MEDRQPKLNGRNQKVKFDLAGVNSWADFAAKNAAGTLRADVIVNTDPNDGATVQGTPLSKQTLLSNATVQLLELTGPDPTVDEALMKLAEEGAGGEQAYKITLLSTGWSGDTYAVTNSAILPPAECEVYPRSDPTAPPGDITAVDNAILWTESHTQAGQVVFKAYGTKPTQTVQALLMVKKFKIKV